MAEVKRIPVTVATGFLGAGKTTLINGILTAEHGRKIAVIENEFGEVSIDKSLLAAASIKTAEEIFELNNGCICCKVRGDLIRVLTKLCKRKARVDAILIETTGLADPGPIIQSVFTDDCLKENIELDSILTVVDAKHCLQHIREESKDGAVNEAVQQVAFADRLLLNKVDLVSDAEKAEVTRVIKGINSQAQVLECNLSARAPPVEQLLGIGAFRLSRVLEMDPAFLQEDDAHSHHSHDSHDSHSHEHDSHGEHASHDGRDAHGKHGHTHDSRVRSVALQATGCLHPKALNAWLGQLLQERGPDLFRSKGVLCLAGEETKTVFQGVHNMWQFGESSQPQAPTRLNQMVFIGRDLDRAELDASFKACFLPAEA